MDAVKKHKEIVKDYEELIAEYKQMLNGGFKRIDSYEMLVKGLTKKIKKQETTIDLLSDLLSIAVLILISMAVIVWIILP